MTIFNILELVESYSSIRIVRRFSEDLVFIGNSFDVPENLRDYPVSMIRIRDSTLIICI